jgi:hypothetical protein
MAWIKLDCPDQEPTVITDNYNYSDGRLGHLPLPLFAVDISLATDVILYSKDTTLLLRSVYRNIKYLTIANKTTE